MNIRDDLIKAKALIDTPEKWGKGGNGESGCYCVSEAVGLANPDTCRIAMARLCSALADFEDDTSDWNSPAVQFNDAPDTTHADIMALFDRAIAACPA